MFRKTLLLTLVGTLLPLGTLAATFGAAEAYSFPAGQTLADDLYVAGGTVSVSGAIRGDVFAAGGSVAIPGAVEQDLFAAGGSVALLGSVGDDARIAGGQLTVSGRIEDDLLVAGGTVHLLPGSHVGGDLIIGGGQVVLEGEVVGNVRIGGGAVTVNGIVGGALEADIEETIAIGPSARIGGAVVYRAPRDASVSASSTVMGGVERLPQRSRPEITDTSAAAKALLGIGIAAFLIKLLGMVGAALFAVWMMRPGTQKLVADAAGTFWPATLRGFAMVLLLPVAGLLLVISVVFSPVGGLLFASFGLLFIAAKILSGILFGAWIVMLITRQKKQQVTLGAAALGTTLLALAMLVPVLGWLLNLIFFLAAFGVLTRWTCELLKPTLTR